MIDAEHGPNDLCGPDIAQHIPARIAGGVLCADFAPNRGYMAADANDFVIGVNSLLLASASTALCTTIRKTVANVVSSY